MVQGSLLGIFSGAHFISRHRDAAKTDGRRAWRRCRKGRVGRRARRGRRADSGGGGGNAVNEAATRNCTPIGARAAGIHSQVSDTRYLLGHSFKLSKQPLKQPLILTASPLYKANYLINYPTKAFTISLVKLLSYNKFE